MLGLATTMVLLPMLTADEKMIPTPGSKVEFPASVTESVANKQVEMRLTGTALRQKAFFSVYAVGSYIASDAKLKNADDLATADVPKRLHLIMERDVSGKDMSANIRTMIAGNFPGEFADELKLLDDYCAKLSLKKGSDVVLVYAPSAGFTATIGRNQALEIANPKFAGAVWHIYFGKKNLGVAVKRGLSTRL